MGFLWVEAIILLDIIIFLMPFLMELLLLKKLLTMNSLPISRFAALAQCQFIWTSERTSSVALEPLDQLVMYPSAHTNT